MNFFLGFGKSKFLVFTLLLFRIFDVIFSHQGQVHVAYGCVENLPDPELLISVVELGLVAVLPDLGQDDGGVEAEKDTQGQGHALDDCPSVESIKVQLKDTIL